MNHNQQFGRRGEEAAARWYRQAGYQIVERNWRCRWGEIDVIATTGDTLVFAEVKARTGSTYGSGFDAVDWRKQRKVRQLAGQWLAQGLSTGRFRRIRFDAVEVDRSGHVRVVENAF